MSRVHVIAIITAKPGKREEVLANFNANVPAVHAEDGCIEYGAVIDCEGVGFLPKLLGRTPSSLWKNGRAWIISKRMPLRPT